MISKAQQLYELFIKETSPMLSLPWDELPDHIKLAWKHVYENAQTVINLLER